MGRCSGDSLFGCNVTTDKQNYVCDQCKGRKIPLTRCRFSEHFMFQGEDGHYICKKPKLQVKKFPFVYGWYHLVVFQSSKAAKKGTEVVNSKRPPRFGLRTPEQVLPCGLWADGIPLTLRKQLHRLIPIGIGRPSSDYVQVEQVSEEVASENETFEFHKEEKMEVSTDIIEPSLPLTPPRRHPSTRRAGQKLRRDGQRFEFSVKMEDINTAPIFQMSSTSPFTTFGPISKIKPEPSPSSLEPMALPPLKREPSQLQRNFINAASPDSGDLFGQTFSTLADYGGLFHDLNSITTFSFTPKIKIENRTVSNTRSRKHQLFEPLSKRRKCAVQRVRTETHDFISKHVVITPHAQS